MIDKIRDLAEDATYCLCVITYSILKVVAYGAAGLCLLMTLPIWIIPVIVKRVRRGK